MNLAKQELTGVIENQKWQYSHEYDQLALFTYIHPTCQKHPSVESIKPFFLNPEDWSQMQSRSYCEH